VYQYVHWDVYQYVHWDVYQYVHWYVYQYVHWDVYQYVSIIMRLWNLENHQPDNKIADIYK